MRLKSGVDWSLEQEADALLAESRQGVTALKDKRDYLTPDQLVNRAKHEILNQNGFCDESLMSGLYRRAFNPLSGKRPTRHSHSGDE